mgnify:FL=1
MSINFASIRSCGVRGRRKLKELRWRSLIALGSCAIKYMRDLGIWTQLVTHLVLLSLFLLLLSSYMYEKINVRHRLYDKNIKFQADAFHISHHNLRFLSSSISSHLFLIMKLFYSLKYIAMHTHHFSRLKITRM